MRVVCLEARPCSSFRSTEDENETQIWPLQLDSWRWRLLPRELLLERILPRLPLLPLLTLRSVCTSWNALLSSPSFWSLWFLSHPSPPPPLLAFLAPPSPPASKLLSQLRKSFASRFVPSSLSPHPTRTTSHSRCWHCIPTNFLASRSPFCVLSSHGGLVLLESRASQKRQLFVYNPLSKACRELPPVSDPDFDLISNLDAVMAVDSELREYFIIFRGCDRGIYIVYESNIQQYKVVAVDREWSNSLRAAPTVIGSDLYWFPDGRVVMNLSYVLVYDRQREALSKIRTRWPGRVVIPRRSQIWYSSQGLMTVAFFEKRVGIWQLISTSWLLTEELPSEATEDSMFGDEITCSCVKVGDFVCLSTPQSGRVFLYDMVKKTWNWSYRCPYSRNLAQSFAFEPRPHAEV